MVKSMKALLKSKNGGYRGSNCYIHSSFNLGLGRQQLKENYEQKANCMERPRIL